MDPQTTKEWCQNTCIIENALVQKINIFCISALDHIQVLDDLGETSNLSVEC